MIRFLLLNDFEEYPFLGPSCGRKRIWDVFNPCHWKEQLPPALLPTQKQAREYQPPRTRSRFQIPFRCPCLLRIFTCEAGLKFYILGQTTVWLVESLNSGCIGATRLVSPLLAAQEYFEQALVSDACCRCASKRVVLKANPIFFGTGRICWWGETARTFHSLCVDPSNRLNLHDKIKISSIKW